MGNERAILERTPRAFPITVEALLALDKEGSFEEAGRVELIEGVILEIGPRSVRAAQVVTELTCGLGMAARELNGMTALSRAGIEISHHNLPEVAIAIADAVTDRERRFLRPDEVRLVVDVSDEPRAYDLGRKLRLYARTGVPEYWVADVGGRRIVRMHAPEGEGYRERTEFAFGAAVPSATIPGLTVDTSRLA